MKLAILGDQAPALCAMNEASERRILTMLAAAAVAVGIIFSSGCAVLAGAAAGGATGYVAGHEAADGD